MANVDTTNSLPMSMRYSFTGTNAIPSRTRLSRFDATSSEYASNSNNKILIPVQADGFIDTTKGYLYLQVQSTHTTTANDHARNLDGNVASIIDKLEISVTGSSGKVETLDNYNLYHLYDQVWNSGVEDITYQQGVNGGSAPALEWKAKGATLAKAGGHGGVADHQTFALKLKSGFLSSYFGKALPQGMPQFTIEITLAPGVQAFISPHATEVDTDEYKVSNCRFYAPVYQILDEQAMGRYNAQKAEKPIAWVAQSFSTITNTIENTASRQTAQLNASFKSLNSMVSLKRLSADINAKNENSLTATNITGLAEYLYRIGGQQYPSDAIDVNLGADANNGLNVSRAYMEASKSLAPHGEIHAKSSAVSLTRFKSAVSAGDNVGAGSMCINLTRFCDDGLVNLGLNTAGSSAPSTIEMNFTAVPGSSTLTTFALYDCVWIMNPNGMIERSF